MNALTQAAQDLLAERQRQDAKWGGAEHDDAHHVSEWVQLIEDYAGWARVMAGMQSYDKARRRLIQTAALALAAAESLDRTYGIPANTAAIHGLVCPSCGMKSPRHLAACAALGVRPADGSKG